MAAKQTKEKIPAQHGRRLTIFRSQLTDLNLEIRLYSQGRKGRTVFLEKEDLRWTFDLSKGRCVFCAVPLVVKGNEDAKPYFRFWTPLKQGGQVRKENLITLCLRCKQNNRSIKRDRPRERIFDFNTIPDIIQRLVQETKELDKCEDEYIRLYQDNIKRIKRELNFAIQEFVQTLSYMPLPEAEDTVVEKRIEENNTAADLIVQMAAVEDETELTDLRLQLVQILKEINKSKEYVVLSF